MIKVGIDNVNIERITDEMFSNLFNRTLSEDEKNEYSSNINKYEFIASHFAAKEAFIKATKNNKIGYKEIELLHFEDNSPYIRYKNEIIKSISITHDKICTAIVILE